MNTWNIKTVKKGDLLALEKQVIKALDYNLGYESPTNFLDRLDMVFGMLYRKSSCAGEYEKMVRKSAEFLCVVMVKDCRFLVYRPSQLAATAMVASLNIVQKTIMEPRNGLRSDLENLELYARVLEPIPVRKQLKFWNKAVQAITLIDPIEEI